MTDHHDDLAARNAAKDARRYGRTTGIAYGLAALTHAALDIAAAIREHGSKETP